MSVWQELSKAEPERDRWGRPLVIPRGGGDRRGMTRISSLGSVMTNTYHLEGWKRRQVVIGLTRRMDLLGRAALAGEDKERLNDIVEEAMEAAGANVGREYGTLMHSIIEMHLKGHPVPDMFAEQIAAFEACRELHGIVFDLEHIEQFVVNETLNAAGSFDYRATIDGVDMIGDLKTGSSLSEGEIAFQTAGYATATSYYDCADDSHTDPEPVSQERAFILHMPKDDPSVCALKFVDLRPAVEAFDHLVFAHKWRNRRGLITPAPTPGDDAKPKAVRKAVRKPKRTLEPVPMPPLPEKTTKAKPKAPKPAKATPEEGEVVPMEKVAELRARATDPTVKEIIARWVAESREADCDFGMSLVRSERRFAISQASVELAETDDDEWARGVLALVVGDDAQKPSVTVGQILGKLTQAEAERVTEIATTATAHYDVDGRLIVQVAS